ncbi:ATP-binding protein [Aureliella helgolandensis]|uniref:histidine kinase n=1 Tax=Aureliella helgolandensis TaxID=2527968 RepID=A0A518G6A4_9BACT|nr:ATP-binding protein [Aureliella helgolandensis]QDV24094.1 Sporulation kinase A [Aureliella helgolandensis]
MASFYVIRGNDNAQHFLVSGVVAKIGRGANVQIHLNDTEVSRQHALIMRAADGEHEIVDNNSSNGTFVNSRRVKRQLLRSGDRVQVGRTLMIYTSGPEPHKVSGGDAEAGSRSVASSSVEIIADSKEHELSNIRQSLESQFAVIGDSLIARESASRMRPAELSGDASDDSQPTSPVDEDSSLDGRDEWEIVFQVGQAVSRTLDLHDLLDQVLELIFQWIACDRGCIVMLDDVTSELTPVCNRDRKQANAAGTSTEALPGSERRKTRTQRIRISRTILDHILQTKEGVLTSNAQDDTRWENVESIATLGVHEAICVPMLGRYGVVGAIYVDTTMSAGVFAERQGENTFNTQHLKLMMAIASQAALAIEDTQFYRAALQSEKLAAMGQTIANLSHHVKNILQGVRGGAYLVDDGLKKGNLEVVQKGWGIVERNQERIHNLVMDMLSFSKEREPELELGDLRDLLSDVCELMETRARENGVQLLWHRPADAIRVEFDSEALHRAVLNVVTNAIDAVAELAKSEEEEQTMPDGISGEEPQATGEREASQYRVDISVHLQAKSNLVQVIVRDTGPGISPEDQRRIFAPFESNKGARGTGLGLPVSRKVLREHGGDISISSQAGRGTEFTLSWPASQTQNLGQTIEQIVPDDSP